MTTKPISNPTIKNLGELTKEMYLFCYDLPTGDQFKNDAALGTIPADTPAFAEKMRDLVRDTATDELNCGFIQMSLYRVDGVNVEKLDKLITHWRGLYNDHKIGSFADMKVFPVGMTDEGYDSFVGMQTNALINWLEDIIKYLKKKEDEGKIMQNALKTKEEDIKAAKTMIDSWFSVGKPDYNEPVHKVMLQKYEHAAQLAFKVKKTCEVTLPPSWENRGKKK